MHIVRFQGGFANQLFQLCLYEKLKGVFGDNNVYADISHYKTCHDHGGFKLAEKYKLKYIKRLPKEYIGIRENNFDITSVEEEKDYYYNGYWQNEKYFPDNIDFLNTFFDKNNLSDENKSIIKDMQENESVSVHVRRGDYLENYMHGNIATKAYILNAMKYMSEHIQGPVFYVFSDDIEWCRDNIGSEFGNVIYVTGNEDQVENDMLMMSNCKHNIISNSSFSWWAQRLNKYEKKIVVSPEYWFNEPMDEAWLLSDNFVKCSNFPKICEEPETPKFSIIVPVYNSEGTLNRCASSVLNQAYVNLEVIFVDDASTDSSLKMLKHYESKDARVKIIHKEKNESLLQARISGIKIAKGDYIIFVDSDDYLSNNACEVLNQRLSKNPVDILEFSYYSEPAKIKYVEKNCIENRIKSILYSECGHSVWNKCYSKALLDRLLKEVDTFYCNMAEDVYLSVVTFSLAESYDQIEDGLYHYSATGGMSRTSNMSMDMLNNAIISLANKDDFLAAYMRKRGILEMDGLKVSSHNDCNYIAHMCKEQSSDLVTKIKMLKAIDDKFSTEYAIQYENEIVTKYNLMEEFYSKSFIAQLKAMLKYVLFRIKRKIVN